MKFIKKDEGFDEAVPGHNQMLIRVKLVQNIDTKYSRFSVCQYLSDGHVEPGSAPGDLIYFCISGKLSIKSGGKEVVMESGDTAYIPAGEVREMKTLGFDPAVAICVYNPIE
jgi:mannose-6-phosphate isomerase-like protein (cupin superfamily)